MERCKIGTGSKNCPNIPVQKNSNLQTHEGLNLSKANFFDCSKFERCSNISKSENRPRKNSVKLLNKEVPFCIIMQNNLFFLLNKLLSYCQPLKSISKHSFTMQTDFDKKYHQTYFILYLSVYADKIKPIVAKRLHCCIE